MCTRVKVISFAEAAELAYFGARVLHPSTMVPAIEKNIPVRILNSYRPDVSGTSIVAERVPCSNAVKSISCKKNITVINISSSRMLGAHGFLRRIFRDIRAPPDIGGYDLDLGSQRFSHYRQSQGFEGNPS